MSKKTQAEVLKVIRDALSLKEGELTLDSAISNLAEWDSLGHLGILSALDKLFEGEIAPLKEMAVADSVKKILEILKANSLI